MRSKSASLKIAAHTAMMTFFQLPNIADSPVSVDYVASTTRSIDLGRLDAASFSPACTSAAISLDKCCDQSRMLGQVANVFSPGFFKRIKVDDPARGHAYYSGTELFQVQPENRGFLSKRSKNIADYIVRKNWLLIQDAGQLRGLIGRIMRVGSRLHDSAVSNHLMRVACEDEVDAAYVFCVLGSPYGYRAITRLAFGTSIPQLESRHVAKIKIPWPARSVREKLGRKIVEAWELYDNADCREIRAINLIEQAIEENA